MPGNRFTDGYGQFMLPHRILADHQFLASATTKVVTGNIYGFDGALLYEATLTTTTTALKAKDSAWTLTTGGAALAWSENWAGFEVLTTTATAYAKAGLGVTATAANSYTIAPGLPIGACPQSVYDSYWVTGQANDTSVIFYNGVNYPILHSFLDTSASGDTVLVAANATKKTLVVGYDVVVGGTANSIRFKDGASSATSLKAFAANGGINKDISKVLFGNAAVNTAINLNLSGATAVGCDVWYIQV